MRVICGVCHEPFEAKRKSARFCGDTCRSRARRGRQSTSGDNDSDLTLQVIADLEAAGQLDSFHGRLAVQLARRMSEKSDSSTSKELRTVMAAALGQQAAPVAGAAAPADEPEDEVEKARRRRDEARAAAAGRS